MEFRQLRTFRAVADNLSFSKAASQLFMAQSSVSAQIRALEEELDLKLFDRIGRRVLITDAGLKLYDYARRIEDMTAEIRSESRKPWPPSTCRKWWTAFTATTPRSI